MSEFDAIVIGAGNAGLTAATTLQRGGAKTLLLERHNIPGGCATSFVRGDYEFEVALHQLSGLGTEDKPFIMRQLFHELGVMDKVEFVQESELYRMVVSNQFDITLPASWSGLRSTLIEHFPSEETNIVKFMKLCEQISLERFMVIPQVRKTNSEQLLNANGRTFKAYGLRDAKSVLDEFFSHQSLKTVLGAYWCYMGMPLKDINFSDLAVMLYAYASYKPWHIKGGSQALSSALLDSFMEAGGEVRFNCAVQSITTDQQGPKPTVTGVITESGESISCQQVISNASSLVTFTDLLDLPALPEGVAQDFKSRDIGTSAFCLYIGLDCSPADLGITNASTFISETMDDEFIQETMGTMNPPVSSMLTCYNVDDPSFAPPGKSQISLLCLQYGEVWESIDTRDYAETKYRYADYLIEQAEKVFPGIRANIEEIEVATPLTMMRYLNTPGGAIYGFKQNAEDNLIYRHHYDQVKGLYIASCWQGMGGFQPTYMLGATTAKTVLNKIHKQKEMTQHSSRKETENA